MRKTFNERLNNCKAEGKISKLELCQKILIDRLIKNVYLQGLKKRRTKKSSTVSHIL